jgi:hypothetical protein
VVACHGGSQNNDVSGTTFAVTYNGVSMTSVAGPLTPGSATARSQMFSLANCGDGAAHTLSVSWSGTLSVIDTLVVGYESATGVTGFSGGASTTGLATNSPTLAVASSTDSYVFTSGAHGDLISGVLLSGTQRYLNNYSQNSAGGCVVGGTWPGAASVTTQFSSVVNDHWTLVGLSLDGTVAGGGQDLPPDTRSGIPPAVLTPLVTVPRLRM